MKQFSLLASLFCLLLGLSGCATIATGIPSSFYSDAPMALAYSDPEVIRDQSQVATLVIPNRYGTTVDGILIKPLQGEFNPSLRVSNSMNAYVYIVDVLPGTHKLKVTYDAITGTDGQKPEAKAGHKVGGGTVSGSYSGPSLFSWMRTSDTTHTLKGGEIYVIGLKMMSISGDIDLFPLDESDRHIIIETRNRAQF